MEDINNEQKRYVGLDTINTSRKYSLVSYYPSLYYRETNSMKTNGYTVNIEYVTNQVMDILDENKDHRSFLQWNQYVPYYRRGNCYYFGLALHYELDYQMVGIMGQWKKAGHVMARGPNGLIYDIGGGYLDRDWDRKFSSLREQKIIDISEPDMIKMLNGDLNKEAGYGWKSYNQMEIEKGIAIIRAYPQVYNPTARNVAIGRHF